MSEEIIYLTGPGSGRVRPHSLPLPEAIAGQLAKGDVRQVNEDGTDWVEPGPAPEEPEAPKEPAKNASKEAWVAYAKAIDDEFTDDDAEAMTRDGLAELYGKK